MAFSCGFYDAINNDRVYSATQFGEMFDGLITDGVYATIGHALAVVSGSGVQVKVRSGRAWFNKTWSVNTADLPLDLELPDLLLPRIDAVILEVDTRTPVRNNSIKVITGEPNVNPTKPTLIRADDLYQYPLAWVTVDQNASVIAASKIENNIGLTPTPFVTGILESVSIDELWDQWEGQFDEWFENIQAQLEGDVAVNLQRQIEELKTNKVNVSDKASATDITQGTSGKWIDAEGLKINIDNVSFKNGTVITSATDVTKMPGGSKWHRVNGQKISGNVFEAGAKDTKTDFIFFPEPDKFGTNHSDVFSNASRYAHSKVAAANSLYVVAYDFGLKRPVYINRSASKEYVYSSILPNSKDTSSDQVSVLYNFFDNRFYLVCPLKDSYTYMLYIFNNSATLLSSVALSGKTYNPVTMYLTNSGEILILTFESSSNTSANLIYITKIKNDLTTVVSGVTYTIIGSTSSDFRDSMVAYNGADVFYEYDGIIYITLIGAPSTFGIYSFYSTDDGNTWTARSHITFSSGSSSRIEGSYGYKILGSGKYAIVISGMASSASDSERSPRFGIYDVTTNKMVNTFYVPMVNILPKPSRYDVHVPIAFYRESEYTYIVPALPTNYDGDPCPIIKINSTDLSVKTYYNVFKNYVNNINGHWFVIPSKKVLIIYNISLSSTSRFEFTKYDCDTVFEVPHGENVNILEIIYFDADDPPRHKTIYFPVSNDISGGTHRFCYGVSDNVGNAIMYDNNYFNIKYDVLKLPKTIDQYIRY